MQLLLILMDNGIIEQYGNALWLWAIQTSVVTISVTPALILLLLLLILLLGAIGHINGMRDNKR